MTPQFEELSIEPQECSRIEVIKVMKSREASAPTIPRFDKCSVSCSCVPGLAIFSGPTGFTITSSSLPSETSGRKPSCGEASTTTTTSGATSWSTSVFLVCCDFDFDRALADFLQRNRQGSGISDEDRCITSLFFSRPTFIVSSSPNSTYAIF